VRDWSARATGQAAELASSPCLPPPLFSCLQLIGKENEGFKGLMLNFNHERFVIAAQARGHR
jgi:hypothetical protein